MALTGYRLLARRACFFLYLAGPWVLLGMLASIVDPRWSAYIVDVVGLLASAAVSVAWSRFVLLGAASPVGGNLGRREWRYLLVSLPMLAVDLLAVMTCYMVLAVVSVASQRSLDDVWQSGWFVWAAWEAGLLANFLSAARFQLMFPAISVDDRAVTFRASLRLTRGSAIAIFLGAVIASAPSSLPSLIFWLPEYPPPGLVLAVAYGLGYLTAMVSAAVLSGFSTELYARQFGTIASVFE